MPDLDSNLIKQVVFEGVSALPVFTDSDTDRFFSSVSDLLETRATKNWENESSSANIAIFVLSKYPRKPFKPLPDSVKSTFDLNLNNDPVFGKIFFLNKGASAGIHFDIPFALSDLIDWFESNNLDKNPFIVAHKDNSKISCRLNVEDIGENQVIHDKPPNLSLSQLREQLDIFPELCLTTPTVCMKGVWKSGKSTSYFPGEEPENQVQIRLAAFLKGWLKRLARVKLEDALDIGRTDICILTPPQSPDDEGLTYWAVIELKIIKDFRYSKHDTKPSKCNRADNIKSLVDGVTQAYAYANETMLTRGFCEVIDMRKDKSEDLRADSKVQLVLNQCQKKVFLCIRPIYGDPDDAQKAGFTI